MVQKLNSLNTGTSDKKIFLLKNSKMILYPTIIIVSVVALFSLLKAIVISFPFVLFAIAFKRATTITVAIVGRAITI